MTITSGDTRWGLNKLVVALRADVTYEDVVNNREDGMDIFYEVDVARFCRTKFIIYNCLLCIAFDFVL